MGLVPESLVQAAADALRARGWRVTTAESCTGGMIAARLTDLAGSSDWFERGFVTYSNDAKVELLGVPAETIAQHGAVSEATALAMARGALDRSLAQVAVAVTGIAGPGGGSAEKPVGTVWFGFVVRGQQPFAALRQFDGDRAAIRAATVAHALERIAELTEPPGVLV
ncbi:CinA family protein [Derxia gummosa]|uniref:CinA family protein n=1 Tax=Derxia gummosa DSM 723 TaxID=1121388 RepID=A0A8B6X1T2_9BURK|nr:CinA family protein [Derxia gummosa]